MKIGDKKGRSRTIYLRRLRTYLLGEIIGWNTTNENHDHRQEKKICRSSVFVAEIISRLMFIHYHVPTIWTYYYRLDSER